MKKTLLCMLMFLFLLPFSGCSEKPLEKANLHIDTSFSGKMGDMNLSGLLIYTEEGEMYLEVSTPDELDGLNFSFNEELTIGYRGLNAMSERDYLPPQSFVMSIKNALDNLRLTPPTSARTEEDTYLFQGKSDSGHYKVYTDVKGNILKLTVGQVEIGFLNRLYETQNPAVN